MSKSSMSKSSSSSMRKEEDTKIVGVHVSVGEYEPGPSSSSSSSSSKSSYEEQDDIEITALETYLVDCIINEELVVEDRLPGFLDISNKYDSVDYYDVQEDVLDLTMNDD